MAKIGDFLKIILSSVFGALMTIIIMSATVIGNKADVEYVDKQDESIVEEMRAADKELKTDFLKEAEEIKEFLKEQRLDIKELMKK